MNIKYGIAAAQLGVAVLAFAPAAQAQSTKVSEGKTELETLRARVEALENSAKTPLRFSLREGTTVEIYGYVKGDLISDSDFSLGDTTGGLATIGLPGGPAAGSFSHGHARQSRLGFRIDAGDVTARVEGDFFGTNNAFRLRHAYGEWNGLLVGQTWTNFMPLDSYPTTVDFQGPAGIPFARVQQVRYTYDNGKGLSLSASLEDDVSGTANTPAVTVAANYGFERGTIRASAIGRDIVIAGTDVDSWGVNVAGTAKLWNGGKILANYTTGEAISDILVFGLSGPAQFTGGRTVDADGITVGISQDIGNKLTLAVAYGQTDLDRATGTNTKELETVHVSAFYRPTDNLTLGLEYFTGTRTQGDGVEFDADRVQFGAQFSF